MLSIGGHTIDDFLNRPAAQISNFAAGEWAIESGAGTITDVGNELKISPNAGATLLVTKSVSLSLHKRSLVLDWKSDAIANLGQGRIYLYDGTGASQYFDGALTGAWNSDTTAYHRIVYHLGNLTGAAINYTNIVKIGFQVAANPAVTPSVWVRSLWWQDNLPVGKIHLSCDDGHASQYTEGVVRCAPYGFPITFFINLSVIGTADRLTIDQIKQIRALGHEIGGHSVSHADLTTVDLLQLQNELREPKQYFEKQGIACDSFSFPFTYANAASLREAYSVYNVCFSWGAGNAAGKLTTPAPADGWCRIELGPTTTLAAISPKIDAVKTHGGLLALFWHSIGNDPTHGVPAMVFQQIIDYIAAQGIECVTSNTLHRAVEQKNTHQVVGTSVKIKTFGVALRPSESGLLLIDTTSGDQVYPLPAASEGDWWYNLYNIGPNLARFDRAGSDTIEEKTSIYVYPNTHQMIISDRLTKARVIGGLRDLLTGELGYIETQVPLAGWTPNNSGSGVATSDAQFESVGTGTTANSRGLLSSPLYGFNLIAVWAQIYYDRKTVLSFAWNRSASDAQVVARMQLKTVATEGALAAKGVGVRADNFALVGESYGSALGEVSLGVSLTDGYLSRITIVIYPSLKIEWYFNGRLVGIQTDPAKIPSGTATAYLVQSIINGAGGGVSATSMLQMLRVKQELN